MAVNVISAVNSSSAAIAYVIDGGRCELVGAVGTTPETAARDFAITRAQFGKRDITRQGYHDIISFTEGEFDPKNPEDAEALQQFADAYARRRHPGRQVVYGVQADGRGGKLHVHFVVNNVTHEPASFSYVDAETGKTITEVQKPGRCMGPSQKSWQRSKHVTNDLLNDQELMRSIGKEAYDNNALVESRGPRAQRDTKFDLEKRAAGEYNYRDDLRERLARVKESAGFTDRDQLKMALAEEGVTLSHGNRFSFSFTDAEGKQRRARPKGKNGLGEDFTQESFEQVMELVQQERRLSRPLPPKFVGTRHAGPKAPAETPGLSDETLRRRAELLGIPFEELKARREMTPAQKSVADLDAKVSALEDQGEEMSAAQMFSQRVRAAKTRDRAADRGLSL